MWDEVPADACRAMTNPLDCGSCGHVGFMCMRAAGHEGSHTSMTSWYTPGTMLKVQWQNNPYARTEGQQ